LTAPINFLVDFLFVDILSAQTEDEVKANLHKRKMITQFASNAANVVRRASIASTARMKQVRKSVVGRHTMKIPEDASSAQTLAVESTSAILVDAQKRLSMMTEFRENNRSQVLVDRQKKSQARKQQPSTRMSRSAVSTASPVDTVEEEVIKRFSAFAVDVTDQRKLLKPHERDRFDTKWGIDPTGEFSKQWTSSGLRSSEKLLKDEMEFVLTETKKKVKKLDDALDAHIGLELLHQFLLDILGRDTPAAKIFLTKSEQDFAHSYVLPRYVKGIAWVVVVLLNLFFIYFSLLRALERGFGWQRLYAIACVLQLVVEIVVYETSEAVLLHFLIPNLARVEVQTAMVALRTAITQICRKQQQPEVALNAPQYFFVSTNVAQHFPQLLESVLIQSYRSCWPGELGRKWKFDHGISLGGSGSRQSVAAMRSFTLSAIMTAILQNLGATAPALQKLCLHSIQPLLVSGLFFLGKLVVHHPLYFLAFLPVVVYLCYLYTTLEPAEESVEGQIHPLPSTSRSGPSDAHAGHSKQEEKNDPDSSPISTSALALGQSRLAQDKRDPISEEEVQERSESDHEQVDQDESIEDGRSSHRSGRFRLDESFDNSSLSLKEKFGFSDSRDGSESDFSLRDQLSVDEISLSHSSRSSHSLRQQSDASRSGSGSGSDSLHLPRIIGSHDRHGRHRPGDHLYDESLSSDQLSSTGHEDSKT
jgi:hypothetical protein